jgi:hypothetical protein
VKIAHKVRIFREHNWGIFPSLVSAEIRVHRVGFVYDASDSAIFGLQSLVVAIVVGGIAIVVGLLRRSRKSS